VADVKDDPTITAAKQGEAEAWRLLYRDHAGRLVVWLSTRAGADSAVSAEDIAAETWLTAASKLQEFSGSAHDFGGWLFGIARNQALNTRRRDSRRRTEPVAAPPELSSAGAADETVGETERVRSLLSALPPRERDVLACLEVVDLDIAQTAQALGLSQGAVRVARHRGLRRLRSVVDVQTPVGTTVPRHRSLA
jgi:RNA polymerase sigma-70 factor, ECF subfamily